MQIQWRAILRTLAAGWLSVGLAASVSARPEYARKEGVACQYCHVSGSPGTLDQLSGRRQNTLRNVRGIYYGAHNHTFQGFVESADTSKNIGPTFRYVWKEEFKTLPRRIAVADVTGDGKPRLITLNEKTDDKNSSTLEVKRWDGKAFTTEFTGDVRAPADRLAVGKMGGSDRPAVILTADALWAWNGSTFTRRPAANLMPLLGVTRLQDGAERVLLAPTSKSVLAYKVNLTAVRQDDWLVDPVAAPIPPKNVWGDMHSTHEFLTSMGVPDQLGAGGLFGIWYIKKYNVYYLYQLDRDTSIGPDPQNPGKPKITYTSTYFITFRETRTGETLWTSPKLPGEGLDLVVDDPKSGGKPGLLVLFNGTTPINATTPGKGRTLAFFAME